MDIILNNQNQNSPIRKATISIKNMTKSCVIDDCKTVALNELSHVYSFVHPLLTQKPLIANKKGVFHYEYQEIESLFNAARLVYATVINTDNIIPKKFEISPSATFKHTKCPKQIYFSIDPHKKAKESIRLFQLEALLSELYGCRYQYSEDIIINSSFTIDDLPNTINAETLFNGHYDIIKLLKKPNNYNQYEIRYIDSTMKFGIFSRNLIKAGTIIAAYSGVKDINTPNNLNYVFSCQDDSLNMCIDGYHVGNLLRLINHGPKSHPSPQLSSQTSFLIANVAANMETINGIEVVVYETTRDIFTGEQLLVDYGKHYFHDVKMYYFNTNNMPVDIRLKRIKSDKKMELNHKRIMAAHGVREAQLHIYKRLILIMISLIMLVAFMNYISAV